MPKKNRKINFEQLAESMKKNAMTFKIGVAQISAMRSKLVTTEREKKQLKSEVKQLKSEVEQLKSRLTKVEADLKKKVDKNNSQRRGSSMSSIRSRSSGQISTRSNPVGNTSAGSTSANQNLDAEDVFIDNSDEVQNMVQSNSTTCVECPSTVKILNMCLPCIRKL